MAEPEPRPTNAMTEVPTITLPDPSVNMPVVLATSSPPGPDTTLSRSANRAGHYIQADFLDKDVRWPSPVLSEFEDTSKDMSCF